MSAERKAKRKRQQDNRPPNLRGEPVVFGVAVVGDDIDKPADQRRYTSYIGCGPTKHTNAEALQVVGALMGTPMVISTARETGEPLQACMDFAVEMFRRGLDSHVRRVVAGEIELGDTTTTKIKR